VVVPRAHDREPLRAHATARPRARFLRAGDTPKRDNVVVADKVQSALKKLQAEARRKSSSDGLGFATWNVPEDLATEDCMQIVLDGAAMRPMQQAKRALGVESSGARPEADSVDW
jgi:hypothetical protein